MKQPRFASSFFFFYAKKMSEKSFTLPSFAKINWFLRVLGKREDGYHQLCTVFQTVSLHDRLTFSESDELIFTCNDKNIPTDDENLIVKAFKLLADKYEKKNGAKIHLEKLIPAPGGLGGGSSNAAVALLGLAKLWQIEINVEELIEIGKQIGSDVPFFFYGGTAFGSGRGTEISPMNDLTEEFILIVTPNVAVSTAEAFKRLNAPRLTNEASKSILQICRNQAESLDLRQNAIVNDFEKTVFENEFELSRVKQKLFEYKSICALMSGSGASIFGVFNNRKEMENALDRLKSERSWRVFPVETVSRNDYQTLLELR